MAESESNAPNPESEGENQSDPGEPGRADRADTASASIQADANAQSSSDREVGDPFDSAVYCPYCSYNLEGLARAGRCPECGGGYTARSVRPRLIPSAFHICLRFGWPVLAMIALWIVSPLLGGYYPIVTAWVGTLVLLVIVLINTLVHGIALVAAFATEEENEQPFLTRLRGLSMLAVVFFHVLIIIPALILGGCLLLLVAASSY